MLDTTTFIGLDVHARSIKAVSLDVIMPPRACGGLSRGGRRCSRAGSTAERRHGARARLLGMGGRPHGRGGVGGGRSPAHKPVTPEAVRSEAVEANLRSLFRERPGRHTRAQTVGST